MIYTDAPASSTPPTSMAPAVVPTDLEGADVDELLNMQKKLQLLIKQKQAQENNIILNQPSTDYFNDFDQNLSNQLI